MSDTTHDGKDKGADEYENVLEGSAATQDHNLKKEGLIVTHKTIQKVKKTSLPPTLKYEPPIKKRDKGKVLGKWLGKFKWSPKVDGHKVKDSELKKAPY